MSTRSNIIIVTPDNQAHQFYHHRDGYLSGVGEELRGMLNESANYEDLLSKLTTPDEYGEVYEDEGKHDQNDPHEMHWDIEFIYIIKNKKLYYIDKFASEIEFFDGHKTYKEVLSLCGTENEINLNKKVRDNDYKYKDPKPEKTEVKTMNYAEEKTRIENEIKRLQSELETLEKRSQKEEWKEELIRGFSEWINKTDLSQVDYVKFESAKCTNEIIDGELWFFYDFKEALEKDRGCKPLKYEKPVKNPVKVETEPTAEPEPEKVKEPEKPENKIVVASVPKPNETTEEKPVKMKMSLDELIKGME